MSTLLEKVCREALVSPPENTHDAIQELAQRLATLKRERRRSLKIERPYIDAHIKDTKCELLRARVAQRHPDCPQLNLEPLTWRNDVGYPRLMLFGLKQPQASLYINFSSNWVDKKEVVPHVPDFLWKCYRDVFGTLYDRFHDPNQGYKTITISTMAPVHLIPDATRRRIRGKSWTFKPIYLLAEVEQWDAEVVVQEDPLVVGVAGEALWLIDRFNTTSVEEYIAREFRT